MTNSAPAAVSPKQLARPALLILLLLVLATPSLYLPLFGALFPGQEEILYARRSMVTLLGEHLLLVAVSSTTATILGVAVGLLVTRNRGKRFMPVVRDLSSLAQTIPPVAVLALSVPLLGYGSTPTVVALFLYSMLPVISNTISGIQGVEASVNEASAGMGMTPRQQLFMTELPLAARVIAAGVRTSVIINIGTAAIGATIGAGGLGVVIIAGLVRSNTAFVLAGAAAAAAVALLADWGFDLLDRHFYDARAASR
ncbi:MAG: ABC transporter permease, partial [Spirochaetaceae bacterium]